MYVSVASCLPTNEQVVNTYILSPLRESTWGHFPSVDQLLDRAETTQYDRKTRISADRDVSTAVANNKRSDSMVNSLSSAHDDPLSRVMALSVV